MTPIVFDFSSYWQVFGMVLIACAGFWGFRVVKRLITGR